MNLRGRITCLRAVEPHDIDAMYAWENDPSVWHVSGTKAPFSRHMLERFVEQQQYDLYATRQMRLMIECLERSKPIGTLDIFEFDPVNNRAGIGILIYEAQDRGKGYAADALATLCDYAGTTLGMHQLWCTVEAGNEASLRLFRAAGFEQAGILRDWNRTPEGYQDEIMMQKIL